MSSTNIFVKLRTITTISDKNFVSRVKFRIFLLSNPETFPYSIQNLMRGRDDTSLNVCDWDL